MFLLITKKNRISRRSINAIKDIKKGDKFTSNNIKIIRPGYGLEPIYYLKILNKHNRLNKNISRKLKIKFTN